jgi:hypothetical protein
VNRATQKAQRVYISELGSVEMNSLVLRFRKLGVSGTDDWHDGVLIKLRFECDHRFERPLDVRWLNSTRPLRKP